jgi:hypothetical protein
MTVDENLICSFKVLKPQFKSKGGNKQLNSKIWICIFFDLEFNYKKYKIIICSKILNKF